MSCTCFAVSRSSRVPSQYFGSGYVSRRHADRNDMTRYYSPSLYLTAHWLEAAGFGYDTRVTITVEHSRLVIETELRF
ncbi:SymE family type I addiction module toxin [Pectobacterium carotovorum]|uniref:SymE family type I addiction module toxin n=1 Tax=Pectobacterium carotovorum TaxID=554 RepID=UPI0029DC1D02|nr:SymE family type I addiction module toxin [Pectobacterium carotovorum]MDX6914707.1 SymE family type I addiction module toxin [Pectobacterium carotovorum]